MTLILCLIAVGAVALIYKKIDADVIAEKEHEEPHDEN